MGKINQEVVRDYGKYQSLLEERKHTTTKLISLSLNKPNHPDTLLNESVVKHSILSDSITLVVESKVENSKDFKFKLRCQDFIKEPFFRFDSSGPTHKNNIPTTPLIKQRVTPPHFHIFDAAGRNFAYKSDALSDREEPTPLEDINLCFNHFCHESNLRYPDDDFSEIEQIPPGDLKLKTEREDPLSNIKF
jgi:hypothetical protein